MNGVGLEILHTIHKHDLKMTQHYWFRLNVIVFVMLLSTDFTNLLNKSFWS